MSFGLDHFNIEAYIRTELGNYFAYRRVTQTFKYDYFQWVAVREDSVEMQGSFKTYGRPSETNFNNIPHIIEERYGEILVRRDK